MRACVEPSSKESNDEGGYAVRRRYTERGVFVQRAGGISAGRRGIEGGMEGEDRPKIS